LSLLFHSGPSVATRRSSRPRRSLPQRALNVVPWFAACSDKFDSPPPPSVFPSPQGTPDDVSFFPQTRVSPSPCSRWVLVLDPALPINRRSFTIVLLFLPRRLRVPSGTLPLLLVEGVFFLSMTISSRYFRRAASVPLFVSRPGPFSVLVVDKTLIIRRGLSLSGWSLIVFLLFQVPKLSHLIFHLPVVRIHEGSSLWRSFGGFFRQCKLILHPSLPFPALCDFFFHCDSNFPSVFVQSPFSTLYAIQKALPRPFCL